MKFINKSGIYLLCGALAFSPFSLYASEEAGTSEEVYGPAVPNLHESSEDSESLFSQSYEEGSLQATSLLGLSEEEVIEIIGPLCTAEQERTGILACVIMAQFILESGWGTTDLAQNANNCFGMKAELSGNSWEDTTWDGVSIYTKNTHEEYGGRDVIITADFRAYPCVEDSIRDHSAYLLNADDGRGPGSRYAGLVGLTDYRAAIQLIKDGGYATDSQYVSKICNIIESHGLTVYNAETYQDSTAADDGSTDDGSADDGSTDDAGADENPESDSSARE